MTDQKAFAMIFKHMKQRKYMPFLTRNREMLREHFPEIKAAYPEAQVFYFGDKEYTCLTKSAADLLVKYLQEHINNLQQEIEDSKQTLADVIKQKGGN